MRLSEVTLPGSTDPRAPTPTQLRHAGWRECIPPAVRDRQWRYQQHAADRRQRHGRLRLAEEPELLHRHDGQFGLCHDQGCRHRHRRHQPNANFADARSRRSATSSSPSNVNDNAPRPRRPSRRGGQPRSTKIPAPGVIATLTASDADGSLNALGYQPTSNPGNMFEIVGNQVRAITGANFNYEAFAAGGASTLQWSACAPATAPTSPPHR